LVRRVGAAAQPVGDGARVDGCEAGEAFHQPAQDLRSNDTGIATRPHERTAAYRVADLRHRVGGRQLGRDRFEGERHVGAGVTVGDGIDVEPVQLFLVHAQRISEPKHRTLEVSRSQARQRLVHRAR
jgi:hypothetical protein